MTKIKEPTTPEYETYETEMEFTCPVRGLVKQKVKIKRLKSVEILPVADIRRSKSVADELDLKFSGLNLDSNELDSHELNSEDDQ